MPRAPLPPSAYISINNDLPCQNPECASHGKPHVGCKCWNPKGGPNWTNFGGVPSVGFAHGGSVSPAVKNFVDLGIMKSPVYKPNLGEPEHFCSARLPHHPDCPMYMAAGGEVENQQFNDNPDLAVEHAIAHHGLHHLLTKTGHSNSPDPTRATQDFIEHSKKGSSKLMGHIMGMFGKQQISPDLDGTEALKAHLEDIHLNPHQLLDVGGTIGDHLPDHAAALAAKAAIAAQYLKTLKPLGEQVSPLDRITPPNKIAQAAYERQVHLAQNPMYILHNAKRGTIQPADLVTLNTIYPQLAKSIRDKAGESLINAKTDGAKIPYKHKMGLSDLMGQPLDSTQTPAAMQAIIKSSTPAQPPQSSKKASAVELKQINKTDQMSMTPDQARQARSQKQ